jgi:hypothetical protein
MRKCQRKRDKAHEVMNNVYRTPSEQRHLKVKSHADQSVMLLDIANFKSVVTSAAISKRGASVDVLL